MERDCVCLRSALSHWVLSCSIGGMLLLASSLAAAAAPQTKPGDSRDLLQQAVAYYTGTAGRVDEAKARELFEEAAEAGDPRATMWIAFCYADAACGFPWDATFPGPRVAWR